MSKLYLAIFAIVLFFVLVTSMMVVQPLSMMALELEYLNRTNDTIYYDGSIDITGNFLINGTPINTSSLIFNGTINGSNVSVENPLNTTISYINDSIDYVFTTYPSLTVNTSLEYNNESLISNATIDNSVGDDLFIEFIYNDSKIVEIIYT